MNSKIVQDTKFDPMASRLLDALMQIAAISKPRQCRDAAAPVGALDATGFDYQMIARDAIVHVETRLAALVNEQAIHEWFGLTYGQFLVVPRVIMSAMPGDWQEKMVALLDQLGETFDYTPDLPEIYYVRVGVPPEWPYEDEDDNAIEPMLSEPPADLCEYRHPRIEHRRKVAP